MSPSLPASLIAKLSPKCRWRGCPRDKADGADWCREHHERQKGYQRKSAAKRRRKRGCYDCGGKLSRRGRCARCRGRQTERRVKDTARRVQNSDQRGRVVHEDRSKYGWAPTAHYVGRDRRGAPSLDDRARDTLIDLGEARRLFEVFTVAFSTARSSGVFSLGRAQRDQALRIVAESGARAARILSGVVLALDPDADVVAADDDE